MTSEINIIAPMSPSLFRQVVHSKLADVALITGAVVCFALGLLCTAGVFRFIGTTNAHFLSFGFYAGAVLFGLAEFVKLIINCRSVNQGQALTEKEVEHLKRRVQRYVSENPNEMRLEKRHNKILKIIDNQNFQMDPIKFLLAGREKRISVHSIPPYIYGYINTGLDKEDEDCKKEVAKYEEHFKKNEFSDLIDEFIFTFCVEEVHKLRKLPGSGPKGPGGIWYGLPL